jgi:FkbM family methyltransferase
VGEGVILIEGLYWPDDVGTKWKHSLKHVKSLDFALARCTQHRTAVQAGGNVGLWPRRMAQVFDRVYTFEPDGPSRECLEANVPSNVIVHASALGRQRGRSGLHRESLGSHRIEAGTNVDLMPLDDLALSDVDLLQLDVEGFEFDVLMGAHETILRCRPLIQLELREFGHAYGVTDARTRALLGAFGYQQISEQPGNDFVFEVPA